MATGLTRAILCPAQDSLRQSCAQPRIDARLRCWAGGAGYAGQARPGYAGSWGLAAIGKKSCRCFPHRRTGFFFLGMRRVRSANPLNIHSPRVPCYMCYMCYISQGLTRQATEHPLSPSSMLYVLYVLYGPTYSTDFARTEHIAHIVHIARSWGRVEVPRLGV